MNKENIANAFDGSTYQPELDFKRLKTLFDAVKALMLDGTWRTLSEIHAAIGRGSEASISARLRDLRKKKRGSHVVYRRRKDRGLFEYRVGTEGEG